MTFTKKSKIILAAVVAVVLAIGGGIFYMRHQEHEKMVAIATSPEAKKVYEEMIYRLDEKALTEDGIIRSYEVDKETLEYNPMGGLMVSLIVNGDEEMDISYNLIDNEDGTYYSAFYTVSKKLSQKLKE